MTGEEAPQSSNSGTNQGDDIASQLINLLRNSLSIPNTNSQHNSENLTIAVKLNDTNYALWSRLMRVAITGRNKLHHLTGNPPPPANTSPEYSHWEQQDTTVFSWVLQNIEANIVSNVAAYPNSRALWEALETTYAAGSDSFQIFELHTAANSLKQGDSSLEKYFNQLQGMWQEIDRRHPNPMRCPVDIETYNKEKGETRLFQFLAGLDKKYETVRREILKEEELPTVEKAYAQVKREAARSGVFNPQTPENQIGMGLLTVNHREAGGARFAGRGKGGRNRSDSAGRGAARSSFREDKSKLVCTHCGMTRHTREQCFQLVGYPEWWEDGHKPGADRGATAKGNLSVGGNGEREGGEDLAAAASANGQEKDTGKGIGTCLYPEWILDCGATDTMTNDARDLVSRVTPRKSRVQTANGGLSPVMGAGTIAISPTLKVSNCLYVPTLSCKLLSISHVARELQCFVTLYPHFCILQDIRTKEIIGRGTERNGLYYVDEVAQDGTALLARGTVDQQIWLWHRRLGHPSPGYLTLLFPNFKHSQIKSCETCILAKSHRTSFFPSNTRVESAFQLVHSDVWGPAPSSSQSQFRYFLLFIDDFSRMTWVYFLKNKSEVPEKFIMFYNLVRTQYNKQIKILRSDNGGEYVNHTMSQFFATHGLVHQTTCPNSPQQNGVAERKNRLILEITRALMLEAHTPQYFWPEAVSTATYLINRLPSKILDLRTPITTLSQQTKIPPALTLQLRVFGCIVFVHKPKSERTKFEACATKCVFVGYSPTQKGYRCYDPLTRRLYTTLDCNFLETEFYYSTQPPSQGETHIQDQFSWIGVSPTPRSRTDIHPPTLPEPVSSSPENSTSTESIPVNHDRESLSPETPEVIHSSPVISPVIENITSATQLDDMNEMEAEVQGTPGGYVLPARRNRGVPPRRYSPEYRPQRSRYPVDEDEGSLSMTARAFKTALFNTETPRTVEDAKKSEKWVEAMKVEMEALDKNKTWEKCKLPSGKRPVGCRWVYTIKHRADGSIERYKARLVAKGYTQTYGIDYDETFSPVAKLDTIRVLFSIAANFDWPLHQFDVKNAFLHGDLREEVYMMPPPGFEMNFANKEVCRLKKALYGLKQSPRAWFGRFTVAMKKYGYKQSNADHTLFLKRRGILITCLIIYVDDMIITGNDGEEIAKLRRSLFSEFEMKDLGNLKYFLGIEVLRSTRGIYISQKKYVLDLLAETSLLDCKPAESPMMVNHGLQMEEGVQLADRERYQRLVGKLIYLSHTRPDIAYAVGVVSQFMHSPQVHHMEAVVRIVRYLKGTPGKGIVYKKHGHLEVLGYTDADWAGNPVNRRSTSGYFTLVGGNLVTWRSKKQKVVALSSAEAEFRGIAKGLTEILWIRKLLAELGFPVHGRCKLMCDNKAAISISENPVQHDRTKHVEIDRHFIKEKLDDEVIEFPYVRSEDQLADILTKAINGRTLRSVLDKLSIVDPTTQFEGEC